MTTGFPSKARAAFSSGRTITLPDGSSLRLGALTLRMMMLLYSVESPLVSESPRLGGGLGWVVTFYIMAHDTAECERLHVSTGLQGLVNRAGEWLASLGIGLEQMFSIVTEIREMFTEMMELDKPEHKAGEEVTELGKSPQPETAS